MNVCDFDWDDSEMIKAWNKMEKKKSMNKKENKKRKWKVGDYCRALYPVDNWYYEAKIIDMNGDFCTVEFIGYGDSEDIAMTELIDSEGERARKKQIKESKISSDDDSHSIYESEDAATEDDVKSTSLKKNHVRKQPAYNATGHETTFYQQYSAPPPATYAPPSPMPMNMPFIPPPVPMMPQYSAPPAPPIMPHYPKPENDDGFSSMIVAWYMAGYYAGIYSARKKTCRCQR